MTDTSAASAPQLVWAAHGFLEMPACVGHDVEPCWLCGGVSGHGQLVSKWLSDGFTSFDRVLNPRGQYACEACVWVSSRVSPMLGRPAKEGKKFGGNSRNYSHLYEYDWQSPAFGDNGESAMHYANASKGQKPIIREFLAREHAGNWFAAIADSGQKHVVPFTPMNGPGRSGIVLFDDTLVVVPDDQSIVTVMSELLTAGATKEELLNGSLSPRAWQLCAEQLREFEGRYGSDRGGAWFTLALWLAQADTEKRDARIEAEKTARVAKKESQRVGRKAKGTPSNRDRGGPIGRKSGVPKDAKRKRAEALGDAGQQSAGSGTDKCDPGGVGNTTVPEPTGPQPAQLGLFGIR